jgi:hypothetical protein
MIVQALRSGRLVIVAGTTNGYVAEEILAHIGQDVGFSRRHFFRGVTVSPAWITAAHGRVPDNAKFWPSRPLNPNPEGCREGGAASPCSEAFLTASRRL